ncbi:MAG: type VI secretion system-associated protein TagF [Salinibacter sp.]|uniref:type VI secretion system-associated protein TagF n=1 Tax=Salinibacter sp. TaxID=2065818 RepID=UPI0035D4A31D
MRTSSLDAACIGKVPTHGDFVRHRASTPTMRAFDEWVHEGLRRVRERHDSAWEEALDDAPTTRFLFSARGRQAPNALLGVLRASRDRNGRTYPFAVTCELPKSAVRTDQLAHLPLQADSFYTAAEQVVQDATDGTLPYREVTDRVAEIAPSFTPQSSPPAEYSRFLEQQTVGSFLEALFGHFEDGRKYRLFENLLDILLPQRKRSTPRLNYGLQFPLRSGEASPTKTVCFWLDTSLHLLDHPDTECSFFWTPDSRNPASAFLLLFLGSPQADTFFQLLGSGGEIEKIYRLGRARGEKEAQAALSLPEEYGSLLEDRQLHLRAFLQRL